MIITQDAITRLVCACRKTISVADRLHEALSLSQTTELDNIAGDIEDALYDMRGEQTDTLEESETDKLIRDLSIPCKIVAQRLIA